MLTNVADTDNKRMSDFFIFLIRLFNNHIINLHLSRLYLDDISVIYLLPHSKKQPTKSVRVSNSVCLH